MSDPARPTDDELGREVRDAQVKFWSSQPGYIAENWPKPPMTEAELAAAAELDAWGPKGFCSYTEWLAEGRPEPEPEL